MVKKRLETMIFMLVLFMGVGGVVHAQLPDPVGWWTFDDGDGTVAADISGHGYDGTLVDGPAWVDGQYGSALEFTASTDRVDIPPAVFDTISAQCTMTFWAFGADALPTATVAFRAVDSANVRQWSSHLPYSNGQVYFDIGGTANRVNGAVDASLYKGNWTHWGFVKNADTGEMSVYANGEILLQEATGNTLPIGAVTNFTIGSEAEGTASWLGIMDDVRLFNVALTPEQIQAAMLEGKFGPAVSPSPEDGAIDVLRDGDLAWSAGTDATLHEIYFGTNFEDVSTATTASAVYQGQQALEDTSFELGRLDLGATYYWRIDEVNNTHPDSPWKGDVWQFEVEPYSIQVPVDVSNVTASSSAVLNPPALTVNGAGLSGMTHGTDGETMWLSGAAELSPWLMFEFGRVEKLDQMWVWNSNSTSEGFVGWGLKGVSIEYSIDGVDWTALAEPTQLDRAPGLPTYDTPQAVSFGAVPAKYVRINIQSNWGGLLQQYGVAEVQFSAVPVHPREPMPANGSLNIRPDASVAWRSGREAGQHTVYVSDDANAVADGTASSVSSMTNSADLKPLDLQMGQTYYWRVDEVNDAEAVPAWTGPVWTLSIVSAVTVDDFEGYSNLSPNRPFQTWLDGFGYSADEFFPVAYAGNGTGAGIGHDIWSPSSVYFNGALMETGITMPGSSQSMPFYYTNTNGVASQTERTFAQPQDWTVGGAKTLSMAFYGQADNTGTLCVKINNTKIAYPYNAANLARDAWQVWNIDLSSVNVQSVTKLQIGVDGSSASGMILIDDIKLYPTPGELLTPIAPASDNLVGAWKFDEGSGAVAVDSSGHGFNGTITDGTWQAGPEGSALVFNGETSKVTLPAAAWDTIEQQVTVSFWAYVDSTVTQTPVTFAAYQDLAVNNSRVINAHIIYSGTTLYFDAGGNADGYDRISQAASASEYGDAWIHWAFTKNAETGDMKVYRNGMLWLSGTGLTRTMTGVTVFELGAKGEGNFWYGSMDEFQLYDRELTQAEILWLAGARDSMDKPF